MSDQTNDIIIELGKEGYPLTPEQEEYYFSQTGEPSAKEQADFHKFIDEVKYKKSRETGFILKPLSKLLDELSNAKL
jgi:hypothetical protein